MSRVRFVPFAFAAVSMLLTACSILASPRPVLGHQTQLQPQTEAILTCSRECADRGWCGVSSEQQSVILGNALNPAEPIHDRLFLQDSLVNINQVSLATIETVVSGEQSQLLFYHVIAPDQGKSGWVAGWCIAAPPGS